MNDSDKVRFAKKQLSLRLELLNMVFPKLQELSAAGGKNAIKRYLAERFGSEPIDEGSQLFYNEWVLHFDSRERLVRLSFNSRSTLVAQRQITS